MNAQALSVRDFDRTLEECLDEWTNRKESKCVNAINASQFQLIFIVLGVLCRVFAANRLFIESIDFWRIVY